MNFLGPVSYGGLQINTAVVTAGRPTRGYRLDGFTPEPPPPTGYLEKRALADGLDAGDVFLGGRSFALIVTVLGTSAGDFWDLSQGLFAAFSPTIQYAADSANRGFTAFDFSQPTLDIANWPLASYPYGRPLRYYMRPTGSPSYVLERDRDNAGAKGHAKQFAIQLIAKDPRKYLQDVVQYNITTTPTTGSYRGDYPSAPIVTFSVSSVGQSSLTIILNSVSNVINLSTVSSGTFTFDYGARTLVDSTGASRAALYSSIGGFPRVGPAQPAFSLANGAGLSSIYITYREAWA